MSTRGDSQATPAVSCVRPSSSTGRGGGGGGDLSGTIRIDGSSTVAPLTEAVAEGFEQENSGVKVTVGTSGTGGGFEKFCAGETDISDASRAIEPDEVQACKKNGVVNEEVRVATDALTVVVNPENPVNCLTVDQLAAVWGPDSKVSDWDQIPGLKEDFNEELALFGPGTDSGTFDYFTEAINGRARASRSDYQASEDDNVLVQGVAGERGGLAYFGFSYYEENQSRLKALQIRNPKTDRCVPPSIASVQSSSYKPLARPMFNRTCASGRSRISDGSMRPKVRRWRAQSSASSMDEHSRR